MSNDAKTKADAPSKGAQPADAYTQIKWNGWGTKDVTMKVDENDPLVIRHPRGGMLRGLIPFIHKDIMGLDGTPAKLEQSPSVSVEEAVQRLPQPVINDGFVADLQRLLQPSQLKLDGESRLAHFAGKNYRDLWRLRKGMFVRAPDAVALPHGHDDCVKIMQCATKHNVVIIPFGGGTNVVGGVEASPFEKRRMVVTVDLRRMNKMLWMDKESRIARFEVGILGPDLDELLGRHGFMFGHDPDSYIFSTLGGWIASRSSGAMSNRYGDIEQMVLALRVVTPNGVIETTIQPRPCGPDLNALIIGSEGIFGIVTEAVVKIERVPEVRHYEGWLFPTFDDGFRAFARVTELGINPTAMRLYDDDETRMSFALKSEQPMVQHLVSKAVKQYLQTFRGFDVDKISLCIMGFEGTRAEVAFTMGQVKQVFAKFNGFCVGAGAGQNWQEKKYDLPYVRDFALAHKMWADVFETTTVYAEVLALHKAVKDAVRAIWKAEGKKGWIGCHTAHQYKMGCCLYFTYAGQQFDDNDMDLFLRTKRAATEAMLRHKGNLTHHHGIGYEHVPWMERQMGSGGLELLLAIKKTVDPQDICNPSKMLPIQKIAGESAEKTAARRQAAMMFDKMGVPKAKF